MTQIAVEVEQVRKNYGAVEVLRGISFAVPKATFTAVMGKSGSGKSTLLGLISGLERPSEGRILVIGSDVAELDDGESAELRRRSIGIVFQGFNLIPSLSAIENVLLPTIFVTGKPRMEHRKWAAELLDKVGLADRMHNRPAALSGGEQQRVAIARALVNAPSILLADEPTGNLDETTGAAILDLLLTVRRDMGMTLLMVTHDHDIAARADVIIKIRDGRIDDAEA